MFRNVEWLNLNENRMYPFKTTNRMLDTTGRYTLPNSFIVDALIAVPDKFQLDYYLSRYEYSPILLSVTVTSHDGTVSLSGSIQDPSSTLEHSVITLSNSDGGSGKLVVGNLKDLLEGSYEFYPGGYTDFEPCRIIKLQQGITSINGIKSGNVVLATGTNVVITVLGNKIKIDTFDSLCQCDECPSVKTVNGNIPVNNDMKIVGVGCVSVLSTQDGVEIRNDCEEACCGCDEVNDMVDRIRALEERILILENQI